MLLSLVTIKWTGVYGRARFTEKHLLLNLIPSGFGSASRDTHFFTFCLHCACNCASTGKCLVSDEVGILELKKGA